MANPNRRGPRALSEILGELFTVRGYGRLRALRELEEVWNTAVGEPHCHQTRVGEVRRGVLNVMVAHPTLLEELAAFRKPELLQALRTAHFWDADPRYPVSGRPDRGAGTYEGRVLTSTEFGDFAAQAIQVSPGAAGKRRRSRGRSDDRDRTAGED